MMTPRILYVPATAGITMTELRRPEIHLSHHGEIPWADLARLIDQSAGQALTVILETYPWDEDHLFLWLAHHGWATEAATTEHGWYTVTNPEDPAARWFLGVRAWSDCPMIGDPDVSQGEIVFRLGAWQTLTGKAYRHTLGYSTLPTIVDTLRKRARLSLYDGNTSSWWMPPAQIVDMRWQAVAGARFGPPDYKAPTRGYRFDMRSAYLAAAAAVTLPTKRLRNEGELVAFGAPGYYHIRPNHEYGPRSPLSESWARVLDLLPEPDERGRLWVCHPTAIALNSMGLPFEVVDSWTSAKGEEGRLLRPWAEWWRDLQATPDLDPTMRTMLKRGYAEAFGLFATRSGQFYRPDWRHMIVDQVRASLLRRICRTYDRHGGLWPVKIDHDAVWYDPTEYSNATGDVLGDLGVGIKIGNMRFEGVREFSQ